MKQIIHTACNDWTKEANSDDVSYVIITNCGHWGREELQRIAEAIEATASSGAMKSSKAVIVGAKVDDCFVNDYRSLCYESGSVCNSVAVAKFSAIKSMD